MRLKKNVLRLLSCVAVMAAMVMLLLTGCDGGGEAPSSPAESNGTAGSNASSSSGVCGGKRPEQPAPRRDRHRLPWPDGAVPFRPVEKIK